MYVGERDSHWPLGCSDVSLVQEEGAINCCNDHMETQFHACCTGVYIYIQVDKSNYKSNENNDTAVEG